VLEIAIGLGRTLGLTDAEMDALRVASMLHDIGMSAAGDVVAVSNRQLSTVEWGMLKMHPVIAADIIGQAPALKEAVPIVYHHHERYDGGGYIGGLAGEQIPLGARILSVADSYVAMRCKRPYREAKSHPSSIAELVAGAGSQFDPHVVSALQELFELSPELSRRD
jgi:HD-GYP domain-containing protein (c-di-GMP phosphodiesterase class II)